MDRGGPVRNGPQFLDSLISDMQLIQTMHQPEFMLTDWCWFIVDTASRQSECLGLLREG